MFSSQTGYDGRPVPPQLDAVTADTDVVTLGIGGNDIGFTGIIENCAAYTPDGPTRSGAQTCKAYYTAGGTDELAQRIADTQPKVEKVLAAIKAKTTARTYLVGYPAILPEAGTCWPQMPLTTTDFAYLRGVENQLNQMLANAAAAQGATYVDTYTPTIGHDACQLPVVRYIEPLAPVADAAPVHPNRAGEAALADAVSATVT
jgi:lysophospholipase L1-like esterase